MKVGVLFPGLRIFRPNQATVKQCTPMYLLGLAEETKTVTTCEATRFDESWKIRSLDQIDFFVSKKVPFK